MLNFIPRSIPNIPTKVRGRGGLAHSVSAYQFFRECFRKCGVFCSYSQRAQCKHSDYIHNLRSLMNNLTEQESGSSYCVPLTSFSVARPRYDVTDDQLEFLIGERFTIQGWCSVSRSEAELFAEGWLSLYFDRENFFHVSMTLN